ncbi:MAG TPA: hypothetical protein VFR14_08635 [Candidatus Limnocylindrales bacterium]|nr:hypothetical protein [Candidatus Limnocylindrales bacterium]
MTVGALASTASFAPLDAPRTAARVVIIVGPAGAATARYRAEAEEAAAVARRLSSDVVTIYSPEATWDHVRPALHGASIVVYLGHGNGWPSPHRSELYPLTQNGLGLNPVAGGDDVQHQYFGEAYIREHVRLAPGAVVLLHHLCYASGTSEPGVPEGSLGEAQQRIDNFAAGWLDAGAGTVVAEARIGPAYYVAGLLSGAAGAEALWHASPARRGHVTSFDSVRVPGAAAALDPDREWSGFFRSLVTRPTVPGVAGQPVAFGPIPSLAAMGFTFSAPTLDSAPLTGSTTRVSVPVVAPPNVTLPDGIQLATRWIPLDVPPLAMSAVPTDEPAASADPSPAASADPSPAASADPSPVASADPSPVASADLGPLASGAPGTAPSASATPDVAELPTDLVVPEAPGEVVEPRVATVSDGTVTIDSIAPAAPGLYRLVVTLHAPDGRAYDAATQSLMQSLIVRVSLPLSARFGVPAEARVAPGGLLQLPVRVTNTGRIPWDLGMEPGASRRGDRTELDEPRLIARWVDLDGDERLAPASDVTLRVAPGASEVVTIGVVAPLRPGSYLVVLDVRAPLFGSLVASGMEPGVVRVEVLDAVPAGSVGTAT